MIRLAPALADPRLSPSRNPPGKVQEVVVIKALLTVEDLVDVDDVHLCPIPASLQAWAISRSQFVPFPVNTIDLTNFRHPSPLVD